MRIQLSDHFTYRKLLRFTLPSIVMMVFTSIYGVVDGLFVSNFVGKGPFTAVNLVMPVVMIFGGLGFMFGTGGSALVADPGPGPQGSGQPLFYDDCHRDSRHRYCDLSLGRGLYAAYLPLAAGRCGDH